MLQTLTDTLAALRLADTQERLWDAERAARTLGVEISTSEALWTLHDLWMDVCAAWRLSGMDANTLSASQAFRRFVRAF